MAVKHPRQILKMPIDYAAGLTPKAAERIGSDLGIEGEHLTKVSTALKSLYDLFLKVFFILSPNMLLGQSVRETGLALLVRR